MLSRDSDGSVFERNVELQSDYGVPSRILSPAQARELCPLLAGDDILAAAFSPEDGHLTPEAVVQGYAHGARALGAHIRVGCEVTRHQLVGRRDHRGHHDARRRPHRHRRLCRGRLVSELRRDGGRRAARHAASPPGVFTEPISDLSPHLPMTIDFASSFYFHREGPGVLLGMSDPEEKPGFVTETSDDWIPRLIEIASRRAPRIADAGIRGGWAGLYEMTPDHNAIIGEAGGASRFLYATGFSGHGFLQGPAVGEILRDLVLGRPPLSTSGRFGVALRPRSNSARAGDHLAWIALSVGRHLQHLGLELVHVRKTYPPAHERGAEWLLRCRSVVAKVFGDRAPV